MNATSIMLRQPVAEQVPSRGRVAMVSLIGAESAIFTIFVVAYIFYIGKSLSGPAPQDVLKAPVLYSICLLSSSVTIHFAGKALRQGKVAVFSRWWFATITLGAIFLLGTAREWQRLIYHEGLTISTNLFGTTYFSLVGLHAFHVIVGLLCLTLVLIFAVLGHVEPKHEYHVELLSLYWHFVDTVWVVVFTVVYIVGR
jgi:cytochrome c oxidase subunit 3/cytochrome o ubiquinol oxidase subunit 3